MTKHNPQSKWPPKRFKNADSQTSVVAFFRSFHCRDTPRDESFVPTQYVKTSSQCNTRSLPISQLVFNFRITQSPSYRFQFAWPPNLDQRPIKAAPRHVHQTIIRCVASSFLVQAQSEASISVVMGSSVVLIPARRCIEGYRSPEASTGLRPIPLIAFRNYFRRSPDGATKLLNAFSFLCEPSRVYSGTVF